MKILIIDDDPIVILVQRKLLLRCGFKNAIISFENAVKALDYLKDEKPSQPVLVLLDINMPQMNGWEFLTDMKHLEIAETIHVIMVTSSIDELDKELANTYSNVIGFIEKPINAEVICNHLKSIPQINRFLEFED